jgi:hypothetical protein
MAVAAWTTVAIPLGPGRKNIRECRTLIVQQADEQTIAAASAGTMAIMSIERNNYSHVGPPEVLRYLLMKHKQVPPIN